MKEYYAHMNINTYGLWLEQFVKTLVVALLFERDETTLLTGGATLRTRMFYKSLPATRSLSV